MDTGEIVEIEEAGGAWPAVAMERDWSAGWRLEDPAGAAGHIEPGRRPGQPSTTRMVIGEALDAEDFPGVGELVHLLD